MLQHRCPSNRSQRNRQICSRCRGACLPCPIHHLQACRLLCHSSYCCSRCCCWCACCRCCRCRRCNRLASCLPRLARSQQLGDGGQQVKQALHLALQRHHRQRRHVQEQRMQRAAAPPPRLFRVQQAEVVGAVADEAAGVGGGAGVVPLRRQPLWRVGRRRSLHSSGLCAGTAEAASALVLSHSAAPSSGMLLHMLPRCMTSDRRTHVWSHLPALPHPDRCAGVCPSCSPGGHRSTAPWAASPAGPAPGTCSRSPLAALHGQINGRARAARLAAWAWAALARWAWSCAVAEILHETFDQPPPTQLEVVPLDVHPQVQLQRTGRSQVITKAAASALVRPSGQRGGRRVRLIAASSCSHGRKEGCKASPSQSVPPALM